MSDSAHWLEENLTEDSPIYVEKVERGQCKEEGWKFYLRMRVLLPALWSDFNNSIKEQKGKRLSKYKTVEDFARHKFKNKHERHLFILMTSAHRTWKEGALVEDSKNKYIVPWIGDWKKIRKNGYWATDNKLQIRGLTKAIEENVTSMQAVKATAPFLVQDMMRCVRLQEKIDELFGGNPFYPEEVPHSKNNYRRFKLYTEMHDQVLKLKIKINHEWMRINGINPNNPHEMMDMGTMAALIGQNAAAGALTGMTAGLRMTTDANGKLTGDSVMQLGENQILINKDALLLATHLNDHVNKFKVPLPVKKDVEGEVIKEKTNGHAKAN